MKIIDAHVHLFSLTHGNYDWLKPENAPFWPDKSLIHRDFTVQDLTLQTPLSLAGFVHIEAGFDNIEPWREIAWLEKNFDTRNFRSVASIDITLPKSIFRQQLHRLRQFRTVVGCRHIFDNDALSILSHHNIAENLAALASNGLSFDLQMSFLDEDVNHHLLSLLTKLPSLRVVINHSGFPPKAYESAQRNHEMLTWQANLSQFAKFENTAIKCSGWEMIDRKLDTQWQFQIINMCIEIFGATRVMHGSNFPLCLFSQSYQNIWQTYVLNSAISPSHLKALCYSNALKWYNFPSR